MSYSFEIRAASKAAAKAAVAARLAKVMEEYRAMSLSAENAQVAADKFIDLLPDNDQMDVMVQMNGSVGWQNPGDDAKGLFTAAGVGVTAFICAKEEAKPVEAVQEEALKG